MTPGCECSANGEILATSIRLKKGVAVTVLSFLLQRKNNGGANTPLEYVERQIRFHKQAKQLNEATYS